MGFKAIGRNLCESGSLFWRAGRGRPGTGPGALVGGGGAEQCLSIPYHPVSRAKRIIQVCINAHVLLPLCLSLNSQLPPSPTNVRNFSSGTPLYANSLESTVQYCQGLESTCQDGRVV